MKAKMTSKTVIVESTIDYENGFFCDYTTKNNILINFHFYNEHVDNLVFIKNDDILNEIKSVDRWSIDEIISKSNHFSNVTELLRFKNFDRLFYFNRSNWMLGDSNGNILSTVIHLDEIFMHVYCNLETSKEKCQEYLDNLKSEYIIKSEIYFIPNYNWDIEDCEYDEHYTLILDIKLDDEKYRELLGNDKHLIDKIFDDECKLKLIEFLKK